MSRSMKHKGREKTRYISLTHSMIDSPAYKTLKPPAIALLVQLLKRYNSYNNGDIGMACREAADLIHVGKDTADKAFDELIDKGFIKIARNSGFNMKARFSRRWTLTCWPEKEGTPPTNNWRFWKSEIIQSDINDNKYKMEDR